MTASRHDDGKTPVSQMLLNACRRVARDVSGRWVINNVDNVLHPAQWLNHEIAAEIVLMQLSMPADIIQAKNKE